MSRDPPRCLTTDLTGTPLLLKPPKVPLFGLDVLFITTQTVLLTGRLLVPRLVRLIAPVSSPKSHWGRPRSACLVAKRHGDGSDPKQVYYYYECSYTASRLYPIPQYQVRGDCKVRLTALIHFVRHYLRLSSHIETTPVLCCLERARCAATWTSTNPHNLRVSSIPITVSSLLKAAFIHLSHG